MQEKKSQNLLTTIPMQQFFAEVGGLFLFSIKFFQELFRFPHEFNEFIRQAYVIGYKTLLLVGITGFIMGLVLTIQSRPTLAEFGAEIWLPGMVTISIIREIGPVITSLICAGKVGSGIGAELGSMRVTEQLDAMEVSGINPYKYVVVTRVLATTIMIPLLVIYADAIAMFGSYVGYNIHGSMSLYLFFTLAFESLEFIDLIPATIKTILFGFAIGIIGSYYGYTTKYGTEEVGRAANTAVVVSSLAIFIIDLIAVQITDFFIY
ncbi:MAG: MlaE family ABC transporter permease [Bacteroidia bacterium]